MCEMYEVANIIKVITVYVLNQNVYFGKKKTMYFDRHKINFGVYGEYKFQHILDVIAI